MSTPPACPVCGMENTPILMANNMSALIVRMSGHSPTTQNPANPERVIKDANGQVLQDGDTVTVIKDLKRSKAHRPWSKSAPKLKNIRLISMVTMILTAKSMASDKWV